MKLEWAVLAGAALIAAAVALTNHWEAWTRPEGAIFRLNRWTGEVSACAPALPVPKDTDPAWKKETEVSREFQMVCNP